MNYHELLSKVEDQVNLFYREHSTPKLFYHNQSHMMEVLGNTKKIADHYQLDDRSFFIVCAAACFHDAGHLIEKVEFFEAKSAAIAQDLLINIGVDPGDIEAIKQCIMATQMPQLPQTLEEKIVCDADLFNLGTTAFWEKNKLLKKEAEALNNAKMDGMAWRASTISLLESHRFHTDYCQLLLDKTKADNLENLKAKQKKKFSKQQETALLNSTNDQPEETAVGTVAGKKMEKAKKKERPLRGIETMFRISASKNIRISEMADNKANIMISVNSIIISVVLGLMMGNLQENTRLIIPTVILLIVNVATIIYSVLATRPNIADGFFTPEQVKNRTVNLLYFGSFYNMNFKEYDEGLKEMMEDSEFLYGSLSKDTFWQGKVLGRKYKLLRISYTIFLYGIVAAVVAFAAAVIFF